MNQPLNQPDISSYPNGGNDYAAEPATTPQRADAPELMRRVVQGAHETIDHLADVAAPRVQKLQQGVDGSREMLHERADQLRTLSDEWKTSLRGTVRESPLTAVATALVLGMLVARLSR